MDGTRLLLSGYFLATVLGCAASPPYRMFVAPSPSGCEDTYKAAATSGDEAGAIRADLDDAKRASCWLSTWERHDAFDLFTVEFDDQGWLAGSSSDTKKASGQLTLLMKRLNELVSKSQPVSIVVYTHGWHHSARPDDGNMISFRELLADTVKLERALCLDKRRRPSSDSADVCTEQEGVKPLRKVRHVVGVYVGWRGDSVEGPLIADTSIWDRKLAAEKVALGSVQQLYGLLHSFWHDHACHIRDKVDENCVEARMLVIGHSFGGLITYRGLAPRLTTGIVETSATASEAKPPIPYAYGFGDMSVLVNPAFEGTRFEPLAEAAANRQYYDAQDNNPRNWTAQLPILVIAQSKGDWATGSAFPIFRFFTTLFEKTDGPERSTNLRTVGWSRRYVTHELTLRDADPVCGNNVGATDVESKLPAEATWAKARLRNRFREIDRPELDMCDGLVLKRVADGDSAKPLDRPPHMPLWVIQTDTRVVKDHNDYLDPHLFDFIRQLYYTVQAATDCYLKQKTSNSFDLAGCQ